MRIIHLICILSFFSKELCSQKYGAAWIVGYSNDSTYTPKYGKTELNFSTGNLDIKYKYGGILPQLGFTNASLANKDGTLRYFTDGFRIFDGFQRIIFGGDSLNYSDVWRNYYSSGIYPTEYNHIFLPMPGNEDKETVLLHYTLEYYYQDITKRYIYVPAFKMSKIVWDSIRGENFLLFKDSIISKGDFIEPHMTCTKHANGRDWWIIIEDYLTNNHRIYLLDSSGIRLYKTQSIGIPADSFYWTGNSTFTPDGSKFIKYLRGYQIQIFDFNRCTGQLDNPRVVINEIALNKDLCYLAVSPNCRFLYLNSDSLIWQYDLFSNDIKASETLIGVWDGYIFDTILNTAFNQLSLTEDGKIYLSCRASSVYIHVINNPNEKGTNCNFQLRGVEIPAFLFGDLPALPNYKLGPIDGSLCDTLGIDNLPVAEYGYFQDTNQYLRILFRDLSYHEPEKWYWDFGDPGSPDPISSDTSPVHIFSKSGIYQVCLNVKNSKGENTICKNLQLGTTAASETNKDKSIISIYPNPVKDKFNLMINDYLPNDARLILSDEMGREILKSKVYHGWNTINIVNLSNGIYYYSCYDKSVEIGKGKLIKMN